MGSDAVVPLAGGAEQRLGLSVQEQAWGLLSLFPASLPIQGQTQMQLCAGLCVLCDHNGRALSLNSKGLIASLV
jgi:hypothetical protein